MTPSDPNPTPGGAPGGANDFGRYATLGLQYALSIALLTGLGWWLDSLWSTTPWLLVAGVVLGVVAGFVNLVRAVPAAPPPQKKPPQFAPPPPAPPQPAPNARAAPPSSTTRRPPAP